MSKSSKPWYIIGAIVLAITGLWWWNAATKPYYPVIDSPRPVKGLTTAAIKLEEFSDFQCPACKAAQPAVDEALKTFGDRILFSYRHYPLVQIHTKAFAAAL